MRQYVEAPTALPRLNGVLNHPAVQVIDETDTHWAWQGVEWVTDGCAVVDVDVNVCVDDARTAQDGLALDVGDPFYVHHALVCRTVGLDEQYSSRATARLELNETVAVERALRDGPLATVGARVGTTALGVVESVGAVDAQLGVDYGPLALMHMDPYVATRALAAGAVWVDPVTRLLYTASGTPVVVGAGYAVPTGTYAGVAVAAGEDVIWGTGALALRRGPVSVTTTDDLLANERLALAVRLYVPMLDCAIRWAVVEAVA